MLNNVHIKPLLFKAIILLVFGSFFFVQSQASFIYHAYDNDFQQASLASPSVKKDVSPFAGKLSDSHRPHFKLNKRYQAVTPHAILPAAVTLQAYTIVVRANWLIPPVLASTHFLYAKPFRGPPSV